MCSNKKFSNRSFRFEMHTPKKIMTKYLKRNENDHNKLKEKKKKKRVFKS